jgi:sorbitol/mannitol transport system substrate-binding protein
VVALTLALAVLAASLAAAASGRSTAKTISVAIVANPQMQDIAKLTPSLFTKKTGIKVKYTILDEGKLRQVTTRDVGAGGKAFDAVMIGPYEAPQFGVAGLLKDLAPMAKADKAFNYNDLIPAVRNALSTKGHMYASPFYGESSFLMYRKDVLAKKGIKMPLRPTWQQVAATARKIDSSSMAGICLRGKPGWGDLGAAFTTVLNTWGGTWW